MLQIARKKNAFRFLRVNKYKILTLSTYFISTVNKSLYILFVNRKKFTNVN